MLSLATIYIIILTIVLVVGLIRFRKLSVPFKIVTFSVAVTLLMEIGGELLAINHKNNSSLSHIESIANYILYSFTFLYLLKNKTLKKVILVLILLVTAFFIINAIFIQPFDQIFPTNVYLVSNVLFVILALLLFKQMLEHPLNISVIKQSIFWFNTAILIFSTTMFLNLELIKYYAEHHWGKDSLYYFWACSVYTFSILIGVSLLVDNKKPIRGKHG